jgi:hypothetical protein
MTIAVRTAMIKKKHDGVAENPLVASNLTQLPTRWLHLCKLPRPSVQLLQSLLPAHTEMLMGKVQRQESILQKALQTTTLKDTGTSRPNPTFLAFHLFLDDHFLRVASSSFIVFASSFGPPKEHMTFLGQRKFPGPLGGCYC